jgi:hypothetical protein
MGFQILLQGLSPYGDRNMHAVVNVDAVMKAQVILTSHFTATHSCSRLDILKKYLTNLYKDLNAHINCNAPLIYDEIRKSKTGLDSYSILQL